MIYKIVPLSSGFMLTSIIGAIISAVYVYDVSKTLGFTFFLFFTIMFIASLISMTYAPLEAEFDVKREKNRKTVK